MSTKKVVLVQLIEMRAAAMVNAVEDYAEEELETMLLKLVEDGEAWMFGLVEGVSAGALEALACRRVTSQAHVVEISKLFDKVGVEDHVRSLLGVMVPGARYEPVIDENVRLPKGVRNATGGEEELREFVAVCAMNWIEWLVDRYARLRRKVCVAAASSGSVEVLKWARAIGCPWNELTCSEASLHGKLQVLKWARANGCPWDGETCANAARSGRLEVLAWARDNGCPWNAWTCSWAAEAGHLDILKWAREHGCPWNTWTCSWAASGGRLDVLKWVRANGCPWDVDTCAFAAGDGHLEVLKWARANGCPWDKETCANAAYGGYLDVLKWARANGCPWNKAICAGTKRHLDVREWVVDAEDED
ncbi:hypothetical protein CTAYLR_009271 [Chrysophaeum taylorii]|uniref:Ankyrin repeat protein n=1 Tax=Chrysophaeum taylorii TaxID=2483200 RepID=A0AAD7UHN6_9STRA|nr:hypothetical protein CTAYLR_009271 [Chrysophaeum taylorii]